MFPSPRDLFRPRDAYLFFAFLFLLVAFALCLALQAHAQTGAPSTGASDITATVQMILSTIVTVMIGVVIFIGRAALAKYTGIQISDSNAAAVDAVLDQAAHVFINTHLLKGKPITLDTRSEAGNFMLAYANKAIPAKMDQLGITGDSLTQRAEALAAKALNLMPSAPPYATAAAAPANPAVT